MPKFRRRLLGALTASVLVAPLLALSGTAPAVAVDTPTKAPKQPLVFGDFYPAAPFDQVLKQPDGTTFPATLSSAEVGGAFEHLGYTVVRGDDQIWRFANGRDAKGALVPTGAVVGRDRVPAGIAPQSGRTEPTWADAQGQDMRAQMFRQLQIASRKAQAQAAAAGEPRVFRFPVLMLATWYDQEKGQSTPQFQEGNTADTYKKLLDGFGGNPNGTLTEFYFEDSFGTFLVQVDVFGPFTSARSIGDPCYYGGIEPGDDGRVDLDLIDDAIGIGGGGALGMAAEAVPQADPSVNFADYDNDKDNVVDFVGLIHSGPDMAVTGDPCHTWSHAIQMTLGAAPGTPAGFPTSDGVTVDRVFTMPEFNDFGKPLTIGVAAHEMAHALGEPDYYNTGYTSMGSGDWDVMSGGSYLGNPAGSNPSGFNPASRVFQGWTTPTIVTSDKRDVSLLPRRVKPADYAADKPNPRLLLVPTTTIAVGETDKMGHTWTEEDTLGLPKDDKGRFVIEGYYLENMNRTVNAAPIHPKMTRSPYFDRQLLGSGLMTWHFDYHQRSNIINGSNNAQNDANRPQMDVVEWDFNDNTQEQQLSLSRGNAEDLAFSAATGITSGTRQLPPGIPVVTGAPQKQVTFSGAAIGPVPQEHDVVVENNPANYLMKVSASGVGDCTLEVVSPEGKSSGVADSGSIGTAEVITVQQPKAGTWKVRVGDFAACGNYSGTVTFSKPGDVLDTRGAADTWSNFSSAPTGWAFTNIGPRVAEGLDHSADAGGSEAITLDLLQLGSDRADVSPGFVSARSNGRGGTLPVTARKASGYTVPVFNNGGKAVPAVVVEVRRGSPTGPLVNRQTVALPPYSRKDVTFTWSHPSEGAAEFVTTVDPARKVAEAHEGNNSQKSHVRVGSTTPTVLVVDDDGMQDGETAMTGALASLGVPYTVVHEHPTAATLRAYRAVLWETGGERYQGQLDKGDRDALRAYLDNGGKVLFTGPRIIDALGEAPGRTNPGGSEEGQAFLKQYFGAEYLTAAAPNNEDTKVVGTGGALGSGTYSVTQLPGRHIINELKLADYTTEGSVKAIGTVKPLLKTATAKQGAYLGAGVDGDAAHKGFQTMVLGFNLAQLTTADQYATVVGAALKHFGVRTGTEKAPAAAVIHHPAIRNAVAGRPQPVRAFVVGGNPRAVPVLYFRRHGQGRYYELPMTRGTAKGAWHATIPGNAVTPDGVDYYLRTERMYDPRFAQANALAHAIGVALPELPQPIPVRR
ncbi:MAG: hypothetical protein JWN57_1249 [Frankiales bacterium]|jgi:M6 family metalloprotease-like protein|nr:hypothetical protein [Frankiales bacterium]